MLTLGPVSDVGSPNALLFGPSLGILGPPSSTWGTVFWVILHYADMEIQAIMVAGETISYQTAQSVAINATIAAVIGDAVSEITAASESITFIGAGIESITSAMSVNSGEVLQWQTP